MTIVIPMPDTADEIFLPEVQAYLRNREQEALSDEALAEIQLIDMELREGSDSFNKRVPFNPNRWIESEAVDAAVHKLCEGFNPEAQAIRHDYKRVFAVTKILLLNLYYTRSIGYEYWLSFSRDKNRIDVPSRYRKTGMSYKYFLFVLDKLEPDYIKVKDGFHNNTGYGTPSFTSRMKPTDKLADEVLRQLILLRSQIKRHPEMEVIELRGKEKNGVKPLLDYKDAPRVRVMRERLIEYNALLQASCIEHKDFGLGIKLDYADKVARRIFNNGSWNQGGRYYGGWWQNIKRNGRKDILINGNPVVELDYKALHPTMLYQKEGIKLDTKFDPYTLPALHNLYEPKKLRNLVKDMLLIWLNAMNEKKAHYALYDKMKADGYNKLEKRYPDEISSLSFKELKIVIADISERFATANASISTYFFSGIGIKLQRRDSAMAEYVIRMMTNAGRAVLCIHDSFICEEQYKDDLERFMKLAYLTVMRGGPAPLIESI